MNPILISPIYSIYWWVQQENSPKYNLFNPGMFGSLDPWGDVHLCNWTMLRHVVFLLPLNTC